MNHWTRLCLLVVSCVAVLALGTSSAFAVVVNPYPLQYSNFQGADGNQDNPPANVNSGDVGGAYAAGQTTGNATTLDGHTDIDWQALAAVNNACPTPPPGSVNVNAPVGCLATNPDPQANDTIFAGSAKETEPGQWQYSTHDGGATPGKDNFFAAYSADANSVDSAHPATFLNLAFQRSSPSGDTF